MLRGERRVHAAPPEHVCQTGAALMTDAWIVEAMLALENRSRDKRRGVCRRRGAQGRDLAEGEGHEAGADAGSGGALTREGGEDGLAATDMRVALTMPSVNIPITRDPDPTFNRAGGRQSFVVGRPDGPCYRVRSATCDVKPNEAGFYVKTMDGWRVTDVPKTLYEAYQYACTLIRQASASPEASNELPAQPQLPGMTLAEPERTAQEIVAQYAQQSAADLRSTAYLVEAGARGGAIPRGQTAEALEEATRRLRALADEKDRIVGALPHGLTASGVHARRGPIRTPDEEHSLLREERGKSEQEHGRDLLRALRRRTTLPEAERAAPLRVQGAGTLTAQALKEVQAAIDALPLSHREVLAAHGTHIYRQGKGFLRVVHPVVAHEKHCGVGGLYLDELREAYVFNHRRLDAAVVVTHELGHAVHDTLRHLRAGVGQTTQATRTHAPSQQPDFMGIYQQHRTNHKLSPYMRSEPDEMFAEGYMLHHRQNEHLRDAAPELQAYFCNLHEEIERRVRDAQREGRAYFTAPSFASAAR